jgi:hypothetical protein
MPDAQVIESQKVDGEAVMQHMQAAAGQGKHVYSKQMGKFITCVQRSWLNEGVHVVCCSTNRAETMRMQCPWSGAASDIATQLRCALLARTIALVWHPDIGALFLRRCLCVILRLWLAALERF